jgi:hypothetical protein
MIKTQLFTITFFVLCLPVFTKGQTVCTAESRVRLDSVLQKIDQSNFEQTPINDLVVQIGSMFLNTPYVEKTLDIPGDESLVINLTGLDCTTYLETVVTLSRLAKMGKFTFQDYENELEFLRYRNGKKEHYPSRLHYFSDWIYENQKKGILKDITENIGGEMYDNPVGFMSDNPQYYPQLENKAYINQLKKTEAEIRERNYFYIPKEDVERLEKNIRSGDLIAITISADNLDIAHVGIAVEQKGRIHLMHASSAAKEVVISDKPLSEYLKGHKSQSGIMVCRLIDPRVLTEP